MAFAASKLTGLASVVMLLMELASALFAEFMLLAPAAALELLARVVGSGSSVMAPCPGESTDATTASSAVVLLFFLNGLGAAPYSRPFWISSHADGNNA